MTVSLLSQSLCFHRTSIFAEFAMIASPERGGVQSDKFPQKVATARRAVGAGKRYFQAHSPTERRCYAVSALLSAIVARRLSESRTLSTDCYKCTNAKKIKKGVDIRLVRLIEMTLVICHQQDRAITTLTYSGCLEAHRTTRLCLRQSTPLQLPDRWMRGKLRNSVVGIREYAILCLVMVL